MLLINRVDISTKVQISNSVFDDTINQYIEQAQFLDLQDLLGVNFYNDLLRNSTDANYLNLLNELEYNYKGKIYTNVGLKIPLIYYSYARYVKFGSVQDTPFGLVEKTNDFSNKVSSNVKQEIYKQNQQIAFKYWRNVEVYLDRKKELYPLWAENNCITTKNKTFKISKIS